MILRVIRKLCLNKCNLYRKGGWDVKRGGGQRASTHADTKSVAEKSGREISRN